MRRGQPAGGTGSAWRCCRAGCRPRAAAPRRPGQGGEVDLQHVGLDHVSPAAWRRSRAARSRSSSITVRRRSAPAAARSGRPGRARSRPAAGRARVDGRTMPSSDGVVDQEVLAEALARAGVGSRWRAAKRRLVTAAARATRRRRARRSFAPSRCRPRRTCCSRSAAAGLLAQLLGSERHVAPFQHLDQVHAEARHHRRRHAAHRQLVHASSNSGTNCPGPAQPRSPPGRTAVE
jgi:hypothetical protein